jgi:hypothetical protein
MLYFRFFNVLTSMSDYCCNMKPELPITLLTFANTSSSLSHYITVYSCDILNNPSYKRKYSIYSSLVLLLNSLHVSNKPLRLTSYYSTNLLKSKLALSGFRLVTIYSSIELMSLISGFHWFLDFIKACSSCFNCS